MIKYLGNLLNDNPLYIGLSGGVDSIAGCFYLKNKGIKFKAAHLNSKIIPQDDEAEQKVIQFCNKYQIELITKSDLAKYSKGSIEDFARKQRHSFFSELGGQVILCHHLDDAVESYIWNMLRGHPDYMPIPLKSEFDGYLVARPFLLNKKEDLVIYAKKHNLEEFITEDLLNQDLTLNRNWIRNSLVKEINSRNYNLHKVVSKIINKKLNHAKS